MKNLKTCLTAIAFVLAGAAVHVNAAEKSCSDGNVCFQLAPLAGKSGAAQLAEEGFSRTPLGMHLNPAVPAQQALAADGFSRTPLGMHLNPAEPVQQTLAADGFGKTPLGQQLMGQQDAGIA